MNQPPTSYPFMIQFMVWPWTMKQTTKIKFVPIPSHVGMLGHPAAWFMVSLLIKNWYFVNRFSCLWTIQACSFGYLSLFKQHNVNSVVYSVSGIHILKSAFPISASNRSVITACYAETGHVGDWGCLTWHACFPSIPNGNKIIKSEQTFFFIQLPLDSPIWRPFKALEYWSYYLYWLSTEDVSAAIISSVFSEPLCCLLYFILHLLLLSSHISVSFCCCSYIPFCPVSSHITFCPISSHITGFPEIIFATDFCLASLSSWRHFWCRHYSASTPNSHLCFHFF